MTAKRDRRTKSNHKMRNQNLRQKLLKRGNQTGQKGNQTGQTGNQRKKLNHDRQGSKSIPTFLLIIELSIYIYIPIPMNGD